MTILRWSTGVLLILVTVAFPTPGAAQEPQLRLEHLGLDLVVDTDEGTLDGTALLRVSAPDGMPSRITFQLGRLFEVASVRIGGRPVEVRTDVVTYPDWPTFQVLAGWVPIPEDAAPVFEIEIAYRGVLVPYSETGMRYVQDRITPDFVLIRSDALAFPVLGEASLAALRGRPPNDFGFDGSVVLPPGLVLASGGEVERGLESADGVEWHFRSRAPAPFLLLAAARYRTFEGGGWTVHAFEEDSAGARAVGTALDETLGLYRSWLGVPPREGRITIMEIPEGWGSQASLHGGIIQTAEAFRDASSIDEVYHEVAHLWHPPESETPADRWNEGLATFLQARVDAVRGGRPLEAWSRGLRVRLAALDPDRIPPMARYGEENATDLAYSIGAWFFRELYRELGEAGFDRCIGELGARHRSGIDTDTFASHVARCGPGTDLVVETWFRTTDGLRALSPG